MNTQAQHTPGPWRIFWSHAGRERHRIYTGHSAETSEMIADVNEFAPTDGDMEAEAKANARLIAAAPELLEALEDMQERWERVEKLFGGAEFNGVRADTSKEICRAIIAQAKGEA